MAGRQASNVITRYAGIQVQTSALGVNIPVGWGTFRCKCNLVDYLNFQAIAQKSSSGGKGGGSTTTGYTYTASIILALCEGPIDSVTTVYVDSKVYANGTTTALAQAGLSLNTGAVGQAVWSYLTSNYPAHAIGYSGLAIAYAANYTLDSGASTPNHSFEVVRLASFGVSGTKDADPSLVVTDFFTNARSGVPSWGAGLISTSALANYQTYTLAAGLLVSPVIDSQRSASDFLTELLKATNSTCVWSEGLLKFIPYGDTAISGNGKSYTPNLTPVYALNDDAYIVSKDEPPVLVDIMDQSDAYNVVQLEYLDRSNQYNMAIALASDAANVAQYGMRRKDPDTVHCICDSGVAAISAQLFLQRTLYVRAQYKFTLGWQFALLEPGDLLTLTDASLGLSAYPVRIIQIDQDEQGRFQVTAEDAPIGVAHTPLYAMQNGVGYAVNQNIDPGGPEANLLLYSGDASNAAWTKTNVAVTANATTDQYGITTADTLIATAATASPPAGIGKKSGGNGGTTNVITTSAASAAGNLIVNIAASDGSPTLSSVADSASNSYSAGTALASPAGRHLRAFYVQNAAALAISQTVTTTFSANGAGKYSAAISIQGVAASGALDVQGAGVSGTGTTPSIATGTLAVAAEIVIGFVLVGGGNSDSFTEASGWTSLPSIGAGGGGSILRMAYRVVASTASVTYNPTLGTSRDYVANVMSFKAAGSIASVHSIAQAVTAFGGLPYTYAVCLQADVHKNARITLADPSGTNGAYIEVDTSAGAIITPATAIGTGQILAAALNTTLVAGIWQVVLTAEVASASALVGSVSLLSDAGALSWTGDNANALYVSQQALRQGSAAGVYANTLGSPAGPLIFNPLSALTSSPEVWAAVAGGSNWGGCNVWVSVDGGSNYGLVGTIEGPATYGVSTASFASHADPDTSDTLSVDVSASAQPLASAANSGAADMAATMCLIDGELICYQSATLTNPSLYGLDTYIRRGYLGTTIAAHAAGAPFARLNGATFPFPYLAPHVGNLLYAKFQSFNLWGHAVVPLSDCIAYPFAPVAAPGAAPGSAAWTAVGTTLSNGGVSIPAIVITGSSDNPSATSIEFDYRVTGTTLWQTAATGHSNATGCTITSVASGQSYDVSVLYIVGGVPSNREIIATGLVVGTAATGGSPGTTLLNDAVAGTGKTFTCPAGSYGHVDVVLTGPGGNGYIAYGGKIVIAYGGGAGGVAVKLSFAVTPGTTVFTYTIPSAIGSAATCTATGLSLTANSGTSATSGGEGTGGTASGGTNDYTGHNGGLTDAWDGGGAANISGSYVDQTTDGQPGLAPGGGGAGGVYDSTLAAWVAALGAGASIQIIART